MSVFIKRLLAFIIDWNLTLLPFFLIFSFLLYLTSQQEKISLLVVLLCFLLFILAGTVFVIRDILFKGRSPGKRIMGLYIFDKDSLQQPSPKKLFLRNIFFLILFIDGIILLITENTIGDHIANTVVLDENSIEEYKIKQLNNAFNPVSKKQQLTKIIKILAVVFACFIIFIGLIQVALSASKKTEEYKIAYNYFIESETFNELNVDEAAIRLNKYSNHTHFHSGNDTFTQTVTFGFLVNKNSFEVTCHKENDIWEVCEKCTQFR